MEKSRTATFENRTDRCHLVELILISTILLKHLRQPHLKPVRISVISLYYRNISDHTDKCHFTEQNTQLNHIIETSQTATFENHTDKCHFVELILISTILLKHLR